MSINPDELINIDAMGGRTPFERATPGQSLTNDPDTKYAWEQPPKYTDVPSATIDIVADSYEKETYEMIALTLADGMPVGSLASMILQAGFQEGKWNPDLMMLLIEPTMYILAAIAEQCGIDYLLYEGDSYESYDEDDEANEQKSLEVLGKIKQDSSDRLKFKDLKPNKITKESVPQEALEMIENFEPPQEVVSLLERRKEENENNSLLERT
jgi:hypothetical protein